MLSVDRFYSSILQPFDTGLSDISNCQMSSSGTFFNPEPWDQEQLTQQHVTPDGSKSTVHHTLHSKPALESGNQHHAIQHSELQWDEDHKIDCLDTLTISENTKGRENQFNRRSGTFLSHHPATPTSFKDTTIDGRKGR